MTTGQTNIWRVHVRQATLAALRERRPFSEFRREIEERRQATSQVLRAMFIAKVEGDEFSRYPRR
jgi:hypothetical protein